MVVSGEETIGSDKTAIDKDILSTSKPKPRKNILMNELAKSITSMGGKLGLLNKSDKLQTAFS